MSIGDAEYFQARISSPNQVLSLKNYREDSLLRFFAI